MSALQQLGRQEIDRLRHEGEAFKAKAKECFHRADALESELSQIHPSNSIISTEPTPLHQNRRRSGVADSVVALLDSHPERVFTPNTMASELGQRVDPSLVSRLKKERRIAKARLAGYCSVNSQESIRELPPPPDVTSKMLEGIQ